MKKRKSKHLTSEQVAQMAELYPNHTNREIAEKMIISEWTVKSRAQKHKWRKSDDYKREICREVAIRNNASQRINNPKSYAKREVTMLKLHRDKRYGSSGGLNKRQNVTIALSRLQNYFNVTDCNALDIL